MKAIVLDTPGHLRFTQMEEPQQPGPGEALVRIRHVGVCGTDFHAFHGQQPFFTYPRVLGHEVGVEVVATNTGVQNGEIKVGARCAIEPYFNCGHCPACRRGTPNCCAHLNVFGVHIDGGMRDFALVPLSRLHPSDTLSCEQLALVEPLAIGAHAVSRAHLKKGERVLVVGAGPIGLAVTQFALLAGTQVIVMDISDQRLAFCQAQWPRVICLNGSHNPLEMLENSVVDDLPTAVFDATGSSQSMMAAFNYVAYGGRLIFVGLFQGDITFHDPHFHRREITLFSSRNSTSDDFRQIIHFLETDQIHLDAWITHRASSQNLVEALPGWLEPKSGLIKAVVTF